MLLIVTVAYDSTQIFLIKPLCVFCLLWFALTNITCVWNVLTLNFCEAFSFKLLDVAMHLFTPTINTVHWLLTHHTNAF